MNSKIEVFKCLFYMMGVVIDYLEACTFKLALKFGGFKCVFCMRSALELRFILPRGLLFK